ncbi:hypothetical protein BDV96DRAFT_335219 [Lophiotrema nucula]|uniref:GIY-YIG domain-containing protein n=1 Tax=Lophiotrema nucula TaxID=690887 RepID=A0A6A5YH36_9PLEO|nr:hypothetical protein BDV96DRAFT_335219 [Lophiotrema nucula]
MPHVPNGANANILSNFTSHLVSWIDGAEIPTSGPHNTVIAQYGCTINKDFSVASTRSIFKKGMQGIWIGEEKNGKVKIFIRGVTESWQNSIWVENQWIPVSNVDKGQRWKPNIGDWRFKIHLNEWELPNLESKVTSPDTSVLGKTITRLIQEFHENPAPFMGTKIQGLLDKRATQKKGFTLQNVVNIIIQGTKDANLYTTLNKESFTMSDIINAATYRIDKDFPRGMGGIYQRFHTSTSNVTRWLPNTKYIYIGKTVDYRERFDGHPSSKSSYGDLTRNSQQLLSSALCVMSETDINDFAYLVEQIFVCLFETYRSELLVSLSGTLDVANGIEYAEAVQVASYFKTVSKKVFSETRFPGAVSRSSFGVSYGANYSMPFKEWSATMDQLLFVRYDTAIKSKGTGTTIPITVFRRNSPKIAQYRYVGSGTPGACYEMCVFQKYRAGKHFFSARHTQKITDGTMGSRQDQPYQAVFEVRTDGQAHPCAWSRLYAIGPFQNWDEARSLGARIEWEYPPKSGEWRHRYLFAHKVYTFEDVNQVGSHANYIKTIAMVQWLFNAQPNQPQPWMPRLRGCAYVLQTNYNYHTQTIEVMPQQPFTMRSGSLKTKATIVAAMKALDLDNVDGSFGQQKVCDTCAMLNSKVMNNFGSKCIQVPGKNYCRVCLLFGRPCCSWTKNGAVRGERAFSEGMITGQSSNEGKVTSADVTLNKKYRTGLHRQPLPETEEQVQPFTQQLIDVVSLARLEDDLSDAEEADEDFEEVGDGDE